LRESLIGQYLCNVIASYDTAGDQKNFIGLASIHHYSSNESSAGDIVYYRGLECTHFTFLRLYGMGTGIIYHFLSYTSNSSCKVIS
jgi:hypothetical protein